MNNNNNNKAAIVSILVMLIILGFAVIVLVTGFTLGEKAVIENAKIDVMADGNVLLKYKNNAYVHLIDGAGFPEPDYRELYND